MSASAWMAQRGWRPLAFQRQVWRAMAQGRSGLLHAHTGSGKTLAVWLGALQAPAAPLGVLWVTPMRALAADTLQALREPLADLAPDWTVGLRTGDTPSAERARQERRWPSALVTTPESLSLLLARADAAQTLGRVRLVVADEWHELMGSKRGVQLQLAVARLRQWNPGLQVWGLSATLGNLDEALATLVGPAHAGQALRVQGRRDKRVVIDTLLPERVERFPWAGHLGLSMAPAVARELDACASALVFTNTRAQAELWYQALLDQRPEWAGQIALHHGSLDAEVRAWVEAGLKSGALRAVVCTASLDLGVDFAPVERVLQIGSPKGVARLLQRAGRSGHAPGRPSRVTLVPTHSLELVEAAAARAAAQAGALEPRTPPRQPLDALVQHLVTVALGGGFEPEALYREVRQTAAYADLSPSDWAWCLGFVSQDGGPLAAYPDYRRVAPGPDGRWVVPDARLARRHRQNIGTIVADASLEVRFMGGARLGAVEENFVARLRPGDVFLFAGRPLELVRVHEMTAWVRRASASRPAVPRWNGGRMPLSTELADALLAQWARGAEAIESVTSHRRTPLSPEWRAAEPLWALQKRWSEWPSPHHLLAEALHTREGCHLFLYPIAGRSVHLGLASLIAWRVARRQAHTFSIAVNDMGLELLSAQALDWAVWLPEALAPVPLEQLRDEALASLNASELAQRRFREIARVAGLVFQGHPGERRSARQLQASSSLFWEVFQRHDPDNRLLRQARDELLAQELDIDRLDQTLQRLARLPLALQRPPQPTPLGFPLMVERLREKLSTETVADRIARMVAQLEQAADAPARSARTPRVPRGKAPAAR